METLLEAVFFMKGFHGLVLHHACYKKDLETGMLVLDKQDAKRNNTKASVVGQLFVALLLQSPSAFGVDIHPKMDSKDLSCTLGTEGTTVDGSDSLDAEATICSVQKKLMRRGGRSRCCR